MKKALLIAICIQFNLLSWGQINTDSLIAYYPFNNNVLDESGNGKDCQNNKATITKDRFGNANKAYSFADSSYLVMPDSLLYKHNKLSISIWFKTEKAGILIGEQNVEIYNSGSNHYLGLLYIDTSGKLRGKIWNGFKNPVLTSTPKVNDNKWHHAVIVGDVNNLTLYLDDKLVGSQAGEIDNLDMMENQIGIGFFEGWVAVNDGWNQFKGDIDDIRIYKRALTTKDVSDMFKESNPVSISQIGKEQIDVYPNPSEGLVKIDIPQNIVKNASIKVVNANGQILKENKLDAISTELDLTRYAKGIYFIMVLSGNNIMMTNKIIVK